jgi:predicted N-acetyltransferase YhbS
VRVGEAGREEIKQVLRLTHAVRGGGMDLADYVAFNLAQIESPWGRRNLRVLIARGGRGEILASAGFYALRAALDGRELRAAGVGALFTPAEAGDRGHAARLVESALERARAEGCALAIAVSETGPALYEPFGFKALPATEAACVVRMPAPWPKEPAWVEAGDPFAVVEGLRLGRLSDLDALVSIHDATTAGQRLRLLRDRSAWDQALLKMGPGPTLGKDGEDLFRVVERAGRVVAYLFLEGSRRGLLWREHGALPEADDALVSLFWSALARARRDGLERIEGWFLPHAVTDGRLYPVARRARATPAVMALALNPVVDLPRFAREDECRFWSLDSLQAAGG